MSVQYFILMPYVEIWLIIDPVTYIINAFLCSCRICNWQSTGIQKHQLHSSMYSDSIQIKLMLLLLQVHNLPDQCGWPERCRSIYTIFTLYRSVLYSIPPHPPIALQRPAVNSPTRLILFRTECNHIFHLIRTIVIKQSAARARGGDNTEVYTQGERKKKCKNPEWTEECQCVLGTE